MIDYIKYTVDGQTYELIDNGDGTWSTTANAPSVSGNYDLILEIAQGGVVTYIDSNDPRYDFYLYVILSAERIVYLQNYVPEFISEVEEFRKIYDTENLELDKLYAYIEKIKSDMFIVTASIETITRFESFMRIKGQGTLEQRKYYLISLLGKGSKLSETVIKGIANTITGSDCIIKFFSSNELDNPEHGQGLLRIQVLSPDNKKDYRYDDIAKAIKPMVPSHIKLLVVKYFATWRDIKGNFADWAAVKAMADWQTVKNYVPPQ